MTPATPSETRSALLNAFEAQIRQSDMPTDWTAERAGAVLRHTAPPGAEVAGGIAFSAFSGMDSQAVKASIAAQVAHFAADGRPWEWKTYGHDVPAELPALLAEAGFIPEDPESLVLGEVEHVLAACAGAELPDGVVLREPSAEDFEGITDLHEAVWGERNDARTREMIAQKDADPDGVTHLVAVADGRVVCASRINFHSNTEFASLWGGSTLPEWRNRGIYRVMVAERARMAHSRGFRYLRVDASEDSRPILERMGMHVVSTTTPFTWSAAGAD